MAAGRRRRSKRGMRRRATVKMKDDCLDMQSDLCTTDDDELPLSDTSKLLNGFTIVDDAVQIDPSDESLWSAAVQMFVPFLLAGFGMVAASLLLDKVQHWPVFEQVTEVFILVPALLGLKGNLEMTLASRLSTHANLGHLDRKSDMWPLVLCNLALVLCQATAVGFLASLAAAVLGWLPSGHFNWSHALLLCASSVMTAMSASFVLAVIMVAIVLLSRRCHINPDNVATPIAASLGDLTTLACLSWLASWFHRQLPSSWTSVVVIVVGVAFTPLWAWLAARNEHTRHVLRTGWSPVVAAMLISSVGGLVLDLTVSLYKGVAVFQLVVNGVGGNLVAVQASRISTELHTISHPGVLPAHMRMCISPCAAFWSAKEQSSHAATARMLLLMVVPGHLIFAYTISYLEAGHTSLTATFMLAYLSAALLQVLLLLYIAQIMTLSMWKHHIDPDNSAIPYLTAIGDLLGTLLLGVAFHALYFVGDRDSDVGD